MAAEITGLSDQNLTGWDSQARSTFAGLGLEQVRFITAYDVAEHADDRPCAVDCQRLEELRAGIAAAQAQGKRVLVSFSDAVGCDDRCRPPTTAGYALAVRQFRRKFPQVREYTAWNEPNHRGHVSPSLAASYWRVLAGSCREVPRCIVAAGDFADDAGFTRYAAAYSRALDTEPDVWAIHPYNAVDDRDSTALIEWIDRGTGDRPVWFTEVGALYCSPKRGLLGASPAEASAYQDDRARSLNSLLSAAPARVERVYYYFLAKDRGRQEQCPGFDSALIGAEGEPRPALSTLFPQLPRRVPSPETALAFLVAAAGRALAPA